MRERCARLGSRPHLAGPQPSPRPPPARAAPGPATSSVPMVAFASPPQAPGEEPCSDALDRDTCLEVEALDRAKSGRAGAAAVCALLPDPKLAAECSFNAAEATLASGGVQAYAGAAALCAAAGAFQVLCQEHILHFLDVDVWGASVPQAEHARRAIAAADTVRRVVAGVDPDAAELYVDRFWAQHFANAIFGGVQVRRTDFELFPAEAAPHLRASAVRLYETSEEPTGTLAERVAELEARFASTAPRGPPRPRKPALVHVQDLWPADSRDDARIPTVYYLGGSRRPVSEDARIDLALCVLEAAARRGDRRLLAEAATSADPLIAGSARRLTAAVAR